MIRPIRRKIDTGVQELCDIINDSGIAETVFSCDGHETDASEVFLGYESPMFVSPIIQPGKRSESPAYIDVIPSDDKQRVFDLMTYLSDETSRLVYTDSTPSYRFEIMPQGRLHIEVPHEFAVKENGAGVRRVYRPVQDTVMRLNFLSHLCRQFVGGKRLEIRPLPEEPNYYWNLANLTQYSPDKSKYPLLLSKTDRPRRA